MLTLSLRPHLEARLRVEAEKRGVTSETLAANILATLLEDAFTEEEKKVAINDLVGI